MFFVSSRDSFVLWFITAEKPKYSLLKVSPTDQENTPALRDTGFQKPDHKILNAESWISDPCWNWRKFTPQPSNTHLKITFHDGTWLHNHRRADPILKEILQLQGKSLLYQCKLLLLYKIRVLSLTLSFNICLITHLLFVVIPFIVIAIIKPFVLFH